ncbi:flagellar biosynthesis regulator FlaF [Muricoccus radiodurans]|uniref:flagellar biosynthesis regulator FlaF n=1 Tax=Muricoccus radiodurans TaxID=2231721 RepID=UPI003CEE4C7F
MSVTRNPIAAYGATRAARPLKEAEADVFRRVTGGLRAARDTAEPIGTVRALADNRRLWMAVHGLMADPTNALPRPLRASIISLGHSVLREMDGTEPDLSFLIEVNEQIALGLSGSP